MTPLLKNAGLHMNLRTSDRYRACDRRTGRYHRNTIKREAGFKARRWVVERAHSWMPLFRRLLIRWDKKPENCLAFLHFACGLIAFRTAGLFG